MGFLAGLLFAACEEQSMVVGWVATITDVLCGFFVVVSLVSHLVWLERGRVASLHTSMLALIRACSS